MFSDLNIFSLLRYFNHETKQVIAFDKVSEFTYAQYLFARLKKARYRK